jgi:outer membrane protein assembly factor BamB
VYLVVGDHLLAFDARTGERRWDATLTATATSVDAPAVAAGLVYARTPDTIEAFAAATGARVWSAPLPAPVDEALQGPASVAGGLLWVGSQGGHLFAFDAAGINHCSGTPAVCTPLFDAALSGSTSWSRPIIANGSVYIGAATPTSPIGPTGRIYRFALPH